MAKGVIAGDHPHAGRSSALQRIPVEFPQQRRPPPLVGFDAVGDRPALTMPTIPSTPFRTRPDLPGGGTHRRHRTCWSNRGRRRSHARWGEAEVAVHRGKLAELYYAGRVAGHMNPTDVVDVVRALMPRDTLVSTDVGSHKLLVGQGWTTYSPRTLLMSNGLSSMGFSLPAAIAAKLVHPDRQVVCFVGDGGLAMVQGELRVAASLKIDPIVVVFCDNSLNRIELKQMARQYPSWGTLIDPTDMQLLARSMGCDGIDVDSIKALENVLAGARAKDRPLVIGAKIDPAQYAAQF
jgi:acetolactate synthase-1/2/3 large subunit